MLAAASVLLAASCGSKTSTVSGPVTTAETPASDTSARPGDTAPPTTAPDPTTTTVVDEPSTTTAAEPRPFCETMESFADLVNSQEPSTVEEPGVEEVRALMASAAALFREAAATGPTSIRVDLAKFADVFDEIHRASASATTLDELEEVVDTFDDGTLDDAADRITGVVDQECGIELEGAPSGQEGDFLTLD